MMTPEEVQRTMEFILSSQADSVIRMDRVEENLDRLGENLDRVQENLVRITEEHDRFRVSLREQKESLDILLSVSHDLLRVSKIHNDRLKRLETKGKK
jgi:hypothetical protein